MTAIKLRDYQRIFIDAVRNEFVHGHKRVVGVAPCGAGKTIMTGWMIREALNRNKRSIFFVHRHELIEQTSNTFTALDIPHGIISAGSPMQLDLPVQIASVQTLAKRLDKVTAPDFLICDECHHILANTYKKILDAFPYAFLLGVTATPLRMGGITLADVFTSMVQSLSVNQLISKGNLTPFKYFAADFNIDLSRVKMSHGDFDNKQLAEILIDKSITGDIVQNYNRLAYGKSAICYCVDVNHSKAVADAFCDAGISAAHVDGDTTQKLRNSIVNDFRNGNIKVLCNAELFGEGFDVPNCQAVILARPTQSLTLYIQQSMRAMRPDPNDPAKVAVIIDHVQNAQRHGFPNSPRDWSLIPNIPRKCPNCGQFITPIPVPQSHKDFFKYKGKKCCPLCYHVFVSDSDEQFHARRKEEKSGALIEYDVDFSINNSDAVSVQYRPSTPEEFLSIAKQRNYRIGWVAFQSLQTAKSYDDCLHIADICGYKHGWAWHKWNQISAQKKIASGLPPVLQ